MNVPDAVRSHEKQFEAYPWKGKAIGVGVHQVYMRLAMFHQLKDA